MIVYVWRQKDTEIVAEQLNGAGVKGGVVCYHGGMDSNDRARAQSSVSSCLCSILVGITTSRPYREIILLKFLRGKARICVATVGEFSCESFILFQVQPRWVEGGKTPCSIGIL